MVEETAKLGLEEMVKTMLSFANTHTYQMREGMEIFPGVVRLLDCLSKREDVVLGLVTGNLKHIAWLKAEGLGIKQFFSVPHVAAFGDDVSPFNKASNIGELVRIAGARATELYDGGFQSRVHVGDTPHDIQGAEYGGAKPIGVCTGVHTWDELMQASTNTFAKPSLFYDLTDTVEFLEACALIGPGRKY